MFKQCTNCNEYRVFGNFAKCKHTKSGLQSWCRKCSSKDVMQRDKLNPDSMKSRKKKHMKTEKFKETTKMYNESNKEVIKKHRDTYYMLNRERILLRGKVANLKKYGLTLEEFKIMSSNQNDVCKICMKTNGNRELAVDHDHVTGKNRGLLCGNCNTAIGKLGDNEFGLNRAISYLKNEL
jgi:hypothetical protein